MTRAMSVRKSKTVEPRMEASSGTLSPDELSKIHAYWRACNYLAAGMIYLRDNPLLRKPLKPEHIKNCAARSLGRKPGLSFTLRPSEPADQQVRPRCDLPRRARSRRARRARPGVPRGNVLRDLSEQERRREGMREFFKEFSFPGGIGSHCTPETPGSIHEGGELGYSISHAFGAAFDNPTCWCGRRGDGEAETGPLATSWHSNKFLNPIRDGAVLPILHLNGYKINNPTLLSRISTRSWRTCSRATAGRRTSSRATTLADAPEDGRDDGRLRAGDPPHPERRAQDRQVRAAALADDRPAQPKGWTGPRKWTGTRSKASGGRTRCRCRDCTTIPRTEAARAVAAELQAGRAVRQDGRLMPS
jgi:hypothetical protein